MSIFLGSGVISCSVIQVIASPGQAYEANRRGSNWRLKDFFPIDSLLPLEDMDPQSRP